MSQRQQAIEIVGTAFPGFTAAAQPAAVRPHIGPEFVQMTGKPAGLRFELIEQPATRLDGAQRQGLKCRRLERLCDSWGSLCKVSLVWLHEN